MPRSRYVPLHAYGPVNDMNYRLSYTEGDNTFIVFQVYPWGERDPLNLDNITDVRFRIEQVEGVPAVTVYPTNTDKYANWSQGILSVPVSSLDLLNRDGSFFTTLSYTDDNETITVGRGLVEVLPLPSFVSGPAPVPGASDLIVGNNVIDQVETAEFVSVRWDITVTRDDGERGQFTVTTTHNGWPNTGNASNVFFDVVGGAATSSAVDDIDISVDLGTSPQTMDLDVIVAAGVWTVSYIRTALPNA